MKLIEIVDGEEKEPSIQWRTNGDKSFTIRVSYGEVNGAEKVFVHSNKSRAVLEKMIKDRYTGKKKFF